MQSDDGHGGRQHKLEELKALGLPVLPSRFELTRPSSEIKADFEALEGSQVRVAGRLMRVRLMGKAGFAHILDGAGELQLYFKRDVLGEPAFEYFKLLDVGDIIGVEGTVFRTKTGEITVQADNLVLLAKSYRTLPDKFHGLGDVETRYRQRYLDLIANEDVRRIFRVRSEVVRTIRAYLDSRAYREVETPALQSLYGGAAATPFVTRYEALDMNAYLRIATELYLKRLIIGGMERVYEIGKDFRNEGFSRKNSPEFTMLELYEAYADYQDIMRLHEDLFSVVAQEVLGTQKVEYQGTELDFTPPWRRVSVHDALLEHAHIDLSALPRQEDLLAAARDHGIDVPADSTRGKIVNDLISSLVESHLVQPTFLFDFPVDFPGSLLAKRSPSDPDVVERFESYIAGIEIANAFTELNDPFDQLERMEEAARTGRDEHDRVDRDFVLALEYGMPPTGGLGFGIDRLVMVLTDAHHIRETILFPLLRPRGEHAEP